MKKSNILLLSCLLLIGFSSNTFGQITLPEVTVIGHGYRYLKSMEDTTSAQPVRLLQHRAATFDVKNSEYYEDEYDTYFISFILPEGLILATYDKNGKILRTAEKYKNVALPPIVRNAVANRFPGWSIAKDIYLVSYYSDDPKYSKKQYKVLVENGNKRSRVKISDSGEFID